MKKKVKVNNELTPEVKSCMGQFDTDGQCWTERQFSHPERTIRIATTFSGIGAPEQALKRLGLKTECVFACDIGERYLKFSYKKLAALAMDFTDDDKVLYAQYLYDGNKTGRGESFTFEYVYDRLFVNNKGKSDNIELVKECIDMLTRGMSDNEKKSFIDNLYDEKGRNYVKDSFFANYEIKEEDWYTDIRFLDATKYKGKVDLYVGGSPCQSWSNSGKKLGLDDTRGTLFYDFARTIKECEPKVFIFENVKGMMSCENDDKTGLQAAIEVFESLGYHIYWQILDGEYYGIPQHRERIWLIGFKESMEFKYPVPIALNKRMYDYLDTDILPRSGHVDEPFVRSLTGKESLRLMGFENFNVADSINQLSENRRESILCALAGNSMVVNCIMALYLQMDITKYGTDIMDNSGWEYKPVKIEGTPLKSIKKSRLYSLTDFAGMPGYKLCQLGNDTPKETSPNPQYGRILSPNGICCTIMHMAPPRILVFNEVETSTTPVGVIA